MAARASSLRAGDSGAQRAPGARAALQRPQGAANPAPIRADTPAVAANPASPGERCPAAAPRPLAALRAGAAAPAHAKCRRRCRTALSLAAGPPRPRASSSRLRAPHGGPRAGGAATPAALRGPGAPAVPALPAERAVPDDARLFRAARAPPASPPNNQRLAARLPAARLRLVLRPRPRPLASHTPRVPRPAASRRPTLDALRWRLATPPAPCSLAAGAYGGQPGRPLERSPWSRPSGLSGHPAPLSFPTQGVKGGGKWEGRGRAALRPLKGTR